MIVFEGEGSLFSCGLQTVACPVNTWGTLGNGLAAAFKYRTPGLLAFYQVALKTKQLDVGKLVVYPIPDSCQQVLLFPTKEHFANPSKEEYLSAGFEDLVARYEELGITELGIPALGCGQGQLDYFKNFKPLVEKHLVETPLPVSIILY
jgi:O-acetyl-ADP-ribose deacetylase (regulator of RNase III)